MADQQRRSANIAVGVQTATFWIDESGSKATAGKCLVVAGIKTRRPDDLLREIKSIRERTGFDREFKFGRLSRGSVKAFTDLVDVLADSDSRLMATVVDDTTGNPFSGGRAVWSVHAEIVAQLIVGNTNRNEVTSAFMDAITTPTGRSLGETVKRAVNGRLGATSVISAVSLDSKTNDLLQAADLVAGAVRYHRGESGGNPEKTELVARLAAAFRVNGFDDVRTERVNIARIRQQRGRGTRGLRVISGESSAS